MFITTLEVIFFPQISCKQTVLEGWKRAHKSEFLIPRLNEQNSGTGVLWKMSEVCRSTVRRRPRL